MQKKVGNNISKQNMQKKRKKAHGPCHMAYINILKSKKVYK